MALTEARQRFFRDPIVVQFGKDIQSHQTKDWINREIGKISGVKIVFVELDEALPTGVKLFHNGDVITGQRLRYFVSYARKLGEF